MTRLANYISTARPLSPPLICDALILWENQLKRTVLSKPSRPQDLSFSLAALGRLLGRWAASGDASAGHQDQADEAKNFGKTGSEHFRIFEFFFFCKNFKRWRRRRPDFESTDVTLNLPLFINLFSLVS